MKSLCLVYFPNISNSQMIGPWSRLDPAIFVTRNRSRSQSVAGTAAVRFRAWGRNLAGLGGWTESLYSASSKASRDEPGDRLSSNFNDNFGASASGPGDSNCASSE